MSQAGIISLSAGGGVVFSVTGSNGVTAAPTTGAVIVSGVNATTTTVGVASFSSANFAVSGAGQVTLASQVFNRPYTATAIDYQVLITDATIGVTSTAAPRTITMPLAGMTAGQSWTIKDESGGAQTNNNITVNGNGLNIDGAATTVININYGSVTRYYSGTAFFIV